MTGTSPTYWNVRPEAAPHLAKSDVIWSEATAASAGVSRLVSRLHVMGTSQSAQPLPVSSGIVVMKIDSTCDSP